MNKLMPPRVLPVLFMYAGSHGTSIGDRCDGIYRATILAATARARPRGACAVLAGTCMEYTAAESFDSLNEDSPFGDHHYQDKDRKCGQYPVFARAVLRQD